MPRALPLPAQAERTEMQEGSRNPFRRGHRDQSHAVTAAGSSQTHWPRQLSSAFSCCRARGRQPDRTPWLQAVLPALPSAPGCASQHSGAPAGVAATSIKVWTLFYAIWSPVIHEDRWYLWILEIKSLRAESHKKLWKQAVHLRFCSNVMYQKPVSTKTGEICKGSLPYALFELWMK